MTQEPPSGVEGPSVPVFLLKTKSTPTDAYEDLFSIPQDGFRFEPIFVPVLRHRFDDEGMKSVRRLLRERKINNSTRGDYGGLIFTSQRAVEGFAQLVKEGSTPRTESEGGWPHLQDVPVYSVGPATTRAIKAIPQSPPLRVFGEHTGTGEVLSKYILDHYGQWYRDRPQKPPLLFLVGEQRRDIIPKTLMDDGLPSDTRIAVTETVVYGTGVMESFPADFARVLSETKERPTRWVVVFSPTGCDGMLRGLGYILDEKTGKVIRGPDMTEATAGDIRIATIGPTTRDYLIHTFGVTPDVCADAPSPEGVWQGITDFVKKGSRD